MTTTLNKNNDSIDKEEEPQKDTIFDWSKISNKKIFEYVVKRYPPNLYYFCWLGYFQIKGIDIGLPFRGYWRKHRAYQTAHELSNMRIEGNIIHLLASPSQKKDIKQHDIDQILIRLTKRGVKIWKLAKKEGLWDKLRSIPHEYCLSPEKFIEYFHRHFFFNHNSYLEQVKILENSISTVFEDEDSEISERNPITTRITNLEKISQRNIQQRVLRQEYSSVSCKVRKRFKPKRDITRSALNLPYIAVSKILIYASRREDWFLQESLEEILIKDTDFKSSLEKMDHKAQQYNRRHYTMKLNRVLKVLKTQKLLEIRNRNLHGNIHRTQKFIRATEDGIAFYEYLRKKSMNSITGLEFFDFDKVYNQFRVYKALINTKEMLKKIFLRFILLFGLLLVFLYIFFQLEGTLWVPKNMTRSSSLFKIDLINLYII